MNKKIILLIAFVTFTVLALFVITYQNPENNYKVHRQCVIGNQVKGIDVSYYQGNVDWHKVKESGVLFGFARVSDGLIKIDPKFDKNWNEMKDASIIRGAYQFFRPNQDPTKQAELFVSIVEKAGGFQENDLPSVIDVEVTSNIDSEKITENVLIWINYISSYTNKKPIIYSGPYFWEHNKLGDEFKTYPLWTAHYTKLNECPLIPDPWVNWDFWQFTGSGNVNGVNSIVDINIYNGSFDDLLVFVENSKIVKQQDASFYFDAINDIAKTKENVKIKDATTTLEEEMESEELVEKKAYCIVLIILFSFLFIYYAIILYNFRLLMFRN